MPNKAQGASYIRLLGWTCSLSVMLPRAMWLKGQGSTPPTISGVGQGEIEEQDVYFPARTSLSLGRGWGKGEEWCRPSGGRGNTWTESLERGGWELRRTNPTLSSRGPGSQPPGELKAAEQHRTLSAYLGQCQDTRLSA
ncbi:Dna polymerase Nu [Manis pentadactyla]|nr:Dna polymerase Nu [Manis pentadactyla]